MRLRAGRDRSAREIRFGEPSPRVGADDQTRSLAQRARDRDAVDPLEGWLVEIEPALERDLDPVARGDARHPYTMALRGPVRLLRSREHEGERVDRAGEAPERRSVARVSLERVDDGELEHLGADEPVSERRVAAVREGARGPDQAPEGELVARRVRVDRAEDRARLRKLHVPSA